MVFLYNNIALSNVNKMKVAKKIAAICCYENRNILK